MSRIRLTEESAPATPAAGVVVLYAKSDGYLYAKDDTGTETRLGGLLAASQAQQETGSSLAAAVVPGVQQFHNSAAKAWVVFNGSGTPAVTASYNLDGTTPLVDNGVGDYTINIGNDFSSGNYCSVSMTGAFPVSSAAVTIHVSNAASPLAGSIRVGVSQSAAGVDVARNNIAFFGDLS